jgi:hypothetical protein
MFKEYISPRSPEQDEPCATTIASLVAGSDTSARLVWRPESVRAGRRVMDFDGCGIAVIDPRKAE